MSKSTDHRFERMLVRYAVLVMFTAVFASAASAQSADNNIFGSKGNNQGDQPKTVKEYLAKQRAEKARKDHEELLKRGDELLVLTGQLEAAYERHKDLTSGDRAKLDSVEKLAERIRKSLGGDGDGEDDIAGGIAKEEKLPATVGDAVVNLKEMVVKLVDELKRTSRFTISAVAIQSSNSVLKIIKFLRLRK